MLHLAHMVNRLIVNFSILSCMHILTKLIVEFVLRNIVHVHTFQGFPVQYDGRNGK